MVAASLHFCIALPHCVQTRPIGARHSEPCGRPTFHDWVPNPRQRLQGESGQHGSVPILVTMSGRPSSSKRAANSSKNSGGICTAAALCWLRAFSASSSCSAPRRCASGGCRQETLQSSCVVWNGRRQYWSGAGNYWVAPVGRHGQVGVGMMAWRVQTDEHVQSQSPTWGNMSMVSSSPL